MRLQLSPDSTTPGGSYLRRVFSVLSSFPSGSARASSGFVTDFQDFFGAGVPQNIAGLVTVHSPGNHDHRIAGSIRRDFNPDPMILIRRFPPLVIKPDGDSVLIADGGHGCLPDDSHCLIQQILTLAENVIHLQCISGSIF